MIGAGAITGICLKNKYEGQARFEVPGTKTIAKPR